MCLMWLIPETRQFSASACLTCADNVSGSTILLDKEAKRRRKEAVKAGKPEPNIWGPNEVLEKRISVKEVVGEWFSAEKSRKC